MPVRRGGALSDFIESLSVWALFQFNLFGLLWWNWTCRHRTGPDQTTLWFSNTFQLGSDQLICQDGKTEWLRQGLSENTAGRLCGRAGTLRKHSVWSVILCSFWLWDLGFSWVQNLNMYSKTLTGSHYSKLAVGLLGIHKLQIEHSLKNKTILQ